MHPIAVIVNIYKWNEHNVLVKFVSSAKTMKFCTCIMNVIYIDYN